ncbi:hypothetical protein [Dankookia sp. P2]|uniref:hypothetical protein n=1 Tax=Dankookia sp. P2 TaxID=3423955 RepID=UPI003D676F78
MVRDFTAGPGVGDHIALEEIRWEDLTINDTNGGVKVSWSDGSVLLEGVQKSKLSQDDFMFYNRTGPAAGRPRAGRARRRGPDPERIRTGNHRLPFGC